MFRYSTSLSRFVLAVAFLLLLAACSATWPAEDSPRDQCGPIQPSWRDVRFAVGFAAKFFDPEQWERTYTVEPYKTVVLRENQSIGAIAHTEYLLWNCGYTESDLDNYFSQEYFDVVFSNYDGYTMNKSCQEGKLSLYEFDAVSQGAPYIVRYWVKQQSKTRVLIFMLVYPRESQVALETMAGQVFPNLVSCP